MSDANRKRKAELFNSTAHTETVEKMRQIREDVDAPAKRVYAATGKIADEVNVKGKKRVSRNSFLEQLGTHVLVNGVALPIATVFDLTNSMLDNVDICFNELAGTYEMTGWMRKKYNVQMASAGVQDVADKTPVFQMTQFESDNRIAEQLRLILSGKYGHDGVEDYDIAEAYFWLAVETDIYRQYGLKGYRFVIGDEAGRGTIYNKNVQTGRDTHNHSRPVDSGIEHHLGFSLPQGNEIDNEIDTVVVTKALGEQWHQFYLQVKTDERQATRDRATSFWEASMPVILMPRATLLSEMQISLMYLTETNNVSESEYIDFIIEVTSGTNEPINRRDAQKLWYEMNRAGVEIGAQTKAKHYAHLPKPGDIFTHPRHQWPEGHELYDTNVINDAPALPGTTTDKKDTPRKSSKWSSDKF